MKRIQKIGIIVILAVIALGVALPAIRHQAPAGILYIHLESISWDEMTIESSNLKERVRFEPTAECKLAPIKHGVYRIGILLKSGETIWSEFLHSDTRRRRRVDIFITKSLKPGYLLFRQTANEKDNLFEGEARLEEITREKPFRLDWI